MRLFHTYIGHIRDLELTWLTQRETGDHRTTTNGTLITLTVEFVCANVKDVIANYDGGAKHDGTLTMLRWGRRDLEVYRTEEK
jgi:hypothetical protein